MIWPSLSVYCVVALIWIGAPAIGVSRTVSLKTTELTGGVSVGVGVTVGVLVIVEVGVTVGVTVGVLV